MSESCEWSDGSWPRSGTIWPMMTLIIARAAMQSARGSKRSKMRDQLRANRACHPLHQSENGAPTKALGGEKRSASALAGMC